MRVLIMLAIAHAPALVVQTQVQLLVKIQAVRLTMAVEPGQEGMKVEKVKEALEALEDITARQV